MSQPGRSADAGSGAGLGIVLRPDHALPLHAQIHRALRRRILDGRCPEGSLLPSENEMGEALGVSRITIRRAFDDLAAAGLVRRSRGRGTEVLRRPEQRPVLAHIDGLVEASLVMGRDTTVELLDFAYVPATAEIAAALEIAEGAPVQHALRIRREGGAIFSLAHSWVPEALGRTYSREDLMQTPLVRLLERAGAEFGSAEQVLGAEAATPEAASALGVAPGAALLRVRRLSRDPRGVPIERMEVLYIPERYEYRMQFGPVKSVS